MASGLEYLTKMLKDKASDILKNPGVNASPIDMSSVDTSSIKETLDLGVSGAETKWVQITVIITVLILIGWAIFLIVTKFTMKDKDERQNYLDINSILFGGMGLIPLISILLILMLIVVALLPPITSFIPNINKLVGKFNNFF